MYMIAQVGLLLTLGVVVGLDMWRMPGHTDIIWQGHEFSQQRPTGSKLACNT